MAPASSSMSAIPLPHIGVAMVPGSMTMAWTPMRSTWCRSTSLKPSSANFEAALVSDLRIVVATYSHDEKLRALIERAVASTSRFADPWNSGIVQPLVGDRKTIVRPQVGSMTLDCDILTVPGADLKVVAYMAPAGSPDVGKLDRLRGAGKHTVTRASDVDEHSSLG